MDWLTCMVRAGHIPTKILLLTPWLMVPIWKLLPLYLSEQIFNAFLVWTSQLRYYLRKVFSGIPETKCTNMRQPVSIFFLSGSIFSNKDLASLQMKRNGELLRETTSDSLSHLRQEGEPLLENKHNWPGNNMTFSSLNFSAFV